jgi:hypothetical protein
VVDARRHFSSSVLGTLAVCPKLLFVNFRALASKYELETAPELRLDARAKRCVDGKQCVNSASFRLVHGCEQEDGAGGLHCVVRSALTP